MFLNVALSAIVSQEMENILCLVLEMLLMWE